MTGTDASLVWVLATTNTHTAAKAHELALQAIPAMRSERDIVVLPSDPDTREFWEFCKEFLELSDEQVVWTAGNNGAFTLNHVSADSMAILGKLIEKRVAAGDAVAIVPLTASDDFKAWAVPFAVHKPRLIGEGAAAGGHKGAMHRHIKHLHLPSVLEGIDATIRVPRGFTCSSSADLLIAYQVLGAKEVVVKPVASGEGEGLLSVSSVEELRLYDFPHGDAVLEELLALDKTEDGLLVATAMLAFPGGGAQLAGVDQVVVGTARFGVRTCTQPPAFQAQIRSWTTTLLTALCPGGDAGFGSFASASFASDHGAPVLTSVATGRLGAIHLPKLFAERHSPSACFVSWSTVPKPDVWTFWSRLVDSDAAFVPGVNSAGVFPLVYIKGVAGIFIALGPTAADAARLRGKAEELLRDPAVAKILELVSWTDTVRRIWCSGPRPEYRRETQRFNMPNRCIPLVRKGKDVIILPGGHEPTREYWEFCKEVLELADEQVFWTSGKIYNLDDDISSDPDLVSRLKALVISNSSDKFTLVPYAVTEKFEKWAKPFSELGVSVFGEDLDWIKRYGHKGILHRHMQSLDKPAVVEQIGVKVRVAIGYTCSTQEDLVAAYQLMGIKDVVIKPVFGAAGEGILFVSDEASLRLYDFPMGDVSLEEFLILDRASDGVVLSPAVHYLESKLIGKGMVDQIMIGTSYAGWRASCSKKSFQVSAYATIDRMLQVMQPKGPGGFDFLSVQGNPVLTDVNTGRFNGAHTPKLFQDLYARESALYCWKVKPSLAIDVWTYWGRLQERGLAFVPGKGSKQGVFPVTFLRGLSGTFVAFADTDSSAEALRFAADACLAVMAAGSGPPVVNRFSVFKRSDITKKAHRRIWCQSLSSAQRQSNSADLEVVPLRPIALLRPGLDVVILPSTEAVREMWDFARETNGLAEAQALWVAGDGDDLDSAIAKVCTDRGGYAYLGTGATPTRNTLGEPTPSRRTFINELIAL